MRLTMHLVRKELRDARWIALGVAAATTALVFGSAWFIGRFMGKGVTPEVAAAFVPVWAALGGMLAGAAVAAESFAGDATSRRIDGAALLPVSLARVFTAKLSATLAAWLAAATWAGVVAAVAAVAFGADLVATKEAVIVVAVLASLPIVVAVALLACVLEHGLGAVLGGALLVGGGGFAVVRFSPWEEWGLKPEVGHAGVILVAVALVLGAAARLAFVRGPIHLGWRIRRAALGLGTSLGILLGGGAATAAVLESRVDVEPGDPDADIGAMRVSPDGTYAVVFVGNRRAPTTSQAWSVRLADGRAIRIPGRHWMFHSFGESGRVALWAAERGNGNRNETIRTVDLGTGAVLSTRSADQAEASWPDRWARFHQAIDGILVEWPERGVKQRFDRAWSASASPRPGLLCVWRNGGRAEVVDLSSGAAHEISAGVLRGVEQWSADGRFLRLSVGAGSKTARKEVDCETGAVRDLVPPSGSWGVFGEGPYATFHPEKDTVAIADVRDGRVVAGPWPKRCVAFISGSDRHAITFNGPAPTTLLDLETGRETPLEPNPNRYGYPPSLIHGLPDGSFLLVRNGDGLDVIDADGRTLRTLFAPAH